MGVKIAAITLANNWASSTQVQICNNHVPAIVAMRRSCHMYHETYAWVFVQTSIVQTKSKQLGPTQGHSTEEVRNACKFTDRMFHSHENE